MRKLLIPLFILAWFGASAQTGSKPDFIRTPNSNFTIVDWNFKAKTFNLPHYSSITRRPSQDSLGTIFLSTVDQHIYIKKQAGSVYSPLAFLSDIPSALTFTNDFTKTGTLVGFADTLHRTSLPWTINNTSTSQSALVLNSSITSGNIALFNHSGTTVSGLTQDGYYTGTGIYSQSGLTNGILTFSAGGVGIGRNVADNGVTLAVGNSNSSFTGTTFSVASFLSTILSVGRGGDNTTYLTPYTSTSGSFGKQLSIIGQIVPNADGDTEIGIDIATIFGTSKIASVNSLVGGTGYPNSSTNGLLVGGTGAGAIASITVSGGVIQTASILKPGANYTVGDVLTIQCFVGGVLTGSGGTVTVASVTSYAGIKSYALRAQGSPILTAPSTSAYASLIIPNGSTYTGGISGSLWQDGSHLYTIISGVTRQLDQQIGVSSIFGRNGNVVAQSGDYNTSQVTESGNLYFTNARAIAAPITGYVSGAGVVSATDNILQAIQKLNGNIAASVTGVSSFNTRTGAITLTTADVNATSPTTLGTVTAGAVPYTLLSGTVPTWNQNTTGSAGTLTTSRNINGVGFNGSANITITANTTNSLANGYGILGGSFNGGSAITLRVDTARGKLVTTYGLLDTINAHGASAGYGINTAQFALGNVVVDTVNVASKSWGMAAFYTKNQIITNNFTFPSTHIYKDSTASTTVTTQLSLSNNWISSATTDLYSPALALRARRFSGTDQSSDWLMYHHINDNTSVDELLFGYSFNGAAPTQVLSIDRFGNFNSKITASPTAFTISNGNLVLATNGNHISIAEGANAYKGQTTLVSGTKAISISGLTTSNRAFVSFVSIGGTVTTTWQYAGVCTSGTLTISALTNAGTTNTSDTSVLNYIIY